MRSFEFCNNCGKNGHSFQNCKMPTMSIGVIVFRKNNDNVEYLLIKRKSTIGFVEFIRGKYSLYNREYIISLFNEMTQNEIEMIKREKFENLWAYLWGENVGIQYRSEEKLARDKFNSLKNGVTIGKDKYSISTIMEEISSEWNEAEWGFPKGRRNYQEKDLVCAMREFEEETGYKKNTLNIIQNIFPIDEIFTGSNFKSYKHRYFIAFMNFEQNENNLQNELENNELLFERNEVSEVTWKTYDECMTLFRPYNEERRNILKRVHNAIHKYRIYK